MNSISYRNLLFIILLSFASIACQAQSDDDRSFQATTFNISYGTHLPFADMATDYNVNLGIGGGIQYISKSRWILGAEGFFVFGGEPNVDVLANLRTETGEIISDEKTYGVVFMEQRGFYIGLTAGKIIPLTPQQTKSGLRVTLSTGLFQHFIKIEDRTGGIPQLAGDYIKGYDRLTNGLALTEFVGYQFFGKKGLINFYAGIESTQGFTQNRRSWDFLTQSALEEPRLDVLLGFRVGWVLPIVHDAIDADDIFY